MSYQNGTPDTSDNSEKAPAPADPPFAVTFFTNSAAATCKEETLTLRQLAGRIRDMRRPTKGRLPWLKLARFGNVTTDKKSLRHDANVLAITGIEADYDGEQISFDEAHETLLKAGVRALIYTSPSHTDAAPRWRVLCPLSKEHPPGQREQFMGRLHGLFRGVFAAESFTLSQAYFWGAVGDNPAPRVEVLDGEALDLLDELDAGWMGRPGTKPPNGKAPPNGAAVPRSGPLDEAAMLAAIEEGSSFHTAALRLIGKWAREGIAYLEAWKRIEAAFDAVPEDQRDARWSTRKADLPRCFDDIYPKDRANGAAPVGPDMSMTGVARRAHPELPLELFGALWGRWIRASAEAAACPPDYVAIPLLAVASALIGNARWAEATPGWREPPHLWAAVVGDSGNGKSPGADAILGGVLSKLESRMQGDFPDRLRDWQAAHEAAKAATEAWQADVRMARKKNEPAPPPPVEKAPEQPQAPRLRQNDSTIERVATILASAAPKGLLIVRDELAGWFLGMNVYNDAGRQFWIEAYGGRPYRVERQKHPEPIDVPRLTVAVTGGTQPDRLAELFRDPDDGLLARMLWAWPEPLQFRLGRAQPDTAFAITALDKLRLLALQPGEEGEGPRPVYIKLATDALPVLEAFGKAMQVRQHQAGGLMRSTFGKARGTALRLSLVLTYLWWTAGDGYGPPIEIPLVALEAACTLIGDYFMPMAERVYGDAATPLDERNAATLARWILKTKASEVHVRAMQRTHRLPGLREAGAIHAACELLVEAGWLTLPRPGGQEGRAKAAYRVRSEVFEVVES